MDLMVDIIPPVKGKVSVVTGNLFHKHCNWSGYDERGMHWGLEKPLLVDILRVEWRMACDYFDYFVFGTSFPMSNIVFTSGFVVLSFETEIFTLTSVLQKPNLTSKLIKTSAVKNCCSENKAYYIFSLIIHAIIKYILCIF